MSIMLVCIIVACGNRSKKEQTYIVPESRTSSFDYASYFDAYRDTSVNLSFAGYSLGKTYTLAGAEVIEQSTVTKERLTHKRVHKGLVFSGSNINVEIDLYLVNDTLCIINGKVLRDYYKVIADTYAAKYGEPTQGHLEDSYENQSYSYAQWRFKNQEIHLNRNTDRRINMNARPIYEYNQFRDIHISYNDYKLHDRYNALWKEQRDYDTKMKPIVDSINAAKEKALQESLKEVERRRLLKDANQI